MAATSAFGLLALGAFYGFRFPPGRGLGTAENAMPFDLEVEAPVWRARIAKDGHGTSFLV
jgi:hypothetical protein